MGYELIDEPRDTGFRTRCAKMAADGSIKGYIMTNFDDMTEKELDDDHERRTHASLSQEVYGGKGVKCGNCAAGYYERKKGGGACNGCDEFLKPSKSVYICNVELCANKLCLDCYNMHRATM